MGVFCIVFLIPKMLPTLSFGTTPTYNKNVTKVYDNIFTRIALAKITVLLVVYVWLRKSCKIVIYAISAKSISSLNASESLRNNIFNNT